MNDNLNIRKSIIEELVPVFEGHCKMMIIAGSVAYGPKEAVNSNSDIDIVVCQNGPICDASFLCNEFDISSMPQHRYFDALSLKQIRQGIPVSVHIFNEHSFEILKLAYVADMRIFRQEDKQANYQLFGFCGVSFYDFIIKNVPLVEGGVRTIVPISFIYQENGTERFALGVHRDKIISSRMCLIGEKDYLAFRSAVIEKTTHIMLEEEYRLGKKYKLVDALSRKSKFDLDFLGSLQDELNWAKSKVRDWIS